MAHALPYWLARVQFIERVDEIPELVEEDLLSDVCTEWVAHRDGYAILQDDSGV